MIFSEYTKALIECAEACEAYAKAKRAESRSADDADDDEGSVQAWCAAKAAEDLAAQFRARAGVRS